MRSRPTRAVPDKGADGQGVVAMTDRVYLDRSIAALRSKILVEGIPCDALHKVRMILDLMHARAIDD